MVAVLIPHLDFPFTFVSGHAAVVEQDSVKDVTNCVQAIILTPKGTRIEEPSFGSPDVTFDQQPVDFQGLLQAILDQEQRAHVLLDQHPDLFDQLIADVMTSVTTEESQI